MGLEHPNIVDAIGTDSSSGAVVLTIVDAWDWTDEKAHLLALQAKLNCYFEFIELGQLSQEYPDAAGRERVIDIVTRSAIPPVGLSFLELARESVADLAIEIRTRRVEI